MSIEKLEEIYNDYYYKSQSALNISAFMHHAINSFKDQQDQITELKGKVKKLERAKTYYPMTENKHRALLGNCVDDDEAILHKREIKEANS